MFYQRQLSAGKVNYEAEVKARELLKNAQRLLKTISVRNPFAEFLTLPNSVFKPRRTNAHYLQFIEAITFYKQYQKFHHIDKETGEEYIETSVEDIQEANELIKEVLLRKSDTITGASRNYLENLKIYLQEQNQTTFTAYEIRRKLRLTKTTQWRYHQQLLENNQLKKVKKKGEPTQYYEITNPNEYKELEEQIRQALQECIDQINRSTVQQSSTTKTERTKKTKSAS
ncbi:hypothetical protein [Flavobacterium columnare]|nr:hypothetical protein [Flavobacterium columnare]